jgi:hypothetical protein
VIHVTDPRVHPLVATAAVAYLEAVDGAAPGLVDGLYLTGSAALGDFRPATSDVDFVAVTTRALGTTDHSALVRAHDRLRACLPRLVFDGIYVTWDDLARGPSLRRGSNVRDGRFDSNANGPGDPVTWRTVARYGVVCRGPEPATVRIWADAGALAAWTLANLDSYWRRLLDRASRPGDRWYLLSHMGWGAVWIVLGTSRLHFTLATGEICSKESAGEYALGAFPEYWHRVVRETLRIRRADRARPNGASACSEAMDWLRIRSGSLYATPLARRRDVLAFGEMAITDAMSRPVQLR